MIQISHEIPKQLFNIHDLINDYPYVLAHLIGKDKDYTDFYTSKCETADYSILDNSAFELGESVSFEHLLQAAEVVKPTHVIIPDSINNCDETIEYLEAFLNYLESRYPSPQYIPFGLIAVVQGTTMEEIYKSLRAVISKKCKEIRTIALPFDTLPNTDYHTIRYNVFKEIKNILRMEGLKVHLLGLQNYSEYYLYSNEDRELIKSVDTSAPIIYGWNGVNFNYGGTNIPKPPEKLADNLDIRLTPAQIHSISHNVALIKKILKY